jgi:hypothetical protein
LEVVPLLVAGALCDFGLHVLEMNVPDPLRVASQGLNGVPPSIGTVTRVEAEAQELRVRSVQQSFDLARCFDEAGAVRVEDRSHSGFLQHHARDPFRRLGKDSPLRLG